MYISGYLIRGRREGRLKHQDQKDFAGGSEAAADSAHQSVASRSKATIFGSAMVPPPAVWREARAGSVPNDGDEEQVGRGPQMLATAVSGCSAGWRRLMTSCEHWSAPHDLDVCVLQPGSMAWQAERRGACAALQEMKYCCGTRRALECFSMRVTRNNLQLAAGVVWCLLCECKSAAHWRLPAFCMHAPLTAIH